MKIKLLSAALASLFLAGSALAEDYQWFNSVDYLSTDDDDAYALSSTYYWTPQKNNGPLAEFDYIQPYSQLSTAYFNSDISDTYSIQGEFFINNLLIGAGYSRTDIDNDIFISDDTFTVDSLKLGYLLTKDLLVNVTVVDPEHGEKINIYSARYNHQLSSTDYVGFNINYEDVEDTLNLASKYFTDLGNDNYLSFNINYAKQQEYDDVLNVGASYYFSRETSVSVGFDTEDNYQLGFEHFFNKNIALTAGYFENTDIDENQWRVGFKVNI